MAAAKQRRRRRQVQRRNDRTACKSAGGLALHRCGRYTCHELVAEPGVYLSACCGPWPLHVRTGPDGEAQIQSHLRSASDPSQDSSDIQTGIAALIGCLRPDLRCECWHRPNISVCTRDPRLAQATIREVYGGCPQAAAQRHSSCRRCHLGRAATTGTHHLRRARERCDRQCSAGMG